jgi:hypothetical protein
MAPSSGVENVIFRTRQTIIDRGWTRFDVAAPFVHYDAHGSGVISVMHAISSMAELGQYYLVLVIASYAPVCALELTRTSALQAKRFRLTRCPSCLHLPGRCLTKTSWLTTDLLTPWFLVCAPLCTTLTLCICQDSALRSNKGISADVKFACALLTSVHM